MSKYPFKPSKIGKVPRFYDQWSEENDPDQIEDIADILAWLKPVKSSSSLSNTLGEESSSSRWDNAQPFLQKSISPLGLQEADLVRANSRIKDLYYSARDLLGRRRVKSSLLIIAGIVVGAGLAAAGTLLIPGLGTTIGATIGISLIGAGIGAWAAKEMGDGLFKDEKRYQIPFRDAKKISRYLGWKHSDLEIINGYLYNRGHSVKSPTCQKNYDNLRKYILRDPKNLPKEHLVDFFIQEQALLEKQQQIQGSDPSITQEIAAVQYILQVLQSTRGLSRSSRERLQAANDHIEPRGENNKEQKNTQEKKPNAASPIALEGKPTPIPTPIERPVPFHPSKRYSRFETSFEQTLRDKKYQYQQLDVKYPSQKEVTCRYKIDIDNGQHSAEFYIHHQKRENGDLAEFTVDKTAIQEQNRDAISDVLVLQAVTYAHTTGKKEVTILSGNDDELAAHLIAAALKASLEPTLDPIEYPSNSPEQKQKIDLIMENARALAGETLKRSSSSPVGFVTKPT